MSGILAVFNRNGEPIDREVIEQMLAAQTDRAVDGQRFWIDGPVALAHQHFGITPEEIGEEQPLAADGGQLALTADVRLDNRAGLIPELGIDVADGLRLTDAALLLLAYRRWGPQCVEHLLGDFGFAVWEPDHQRLFVAVDALGLRGVCYHLTEDLLIVASEIDHILAHPAVEPRLNEGKVAETMVRRWMDQRQTLFEGVCYCPPAHVMEVTRDTAQERAYWAIDLDHRVHHRDPRDYAAEYYEILTESVRCRLRSSGHVAVSLSGGLDSTALAAIAARELPRISPDHGRLRSFSYVFDELVECDEREFIAPVVAEFDLDAAFIPSDGLWTLRDFADWPLERDWIWMDPFVWLPLSVMREAERSDCRLLLGGYYGDVLFTGGLFWAAEMLQDRRLRELARVLACRGLPGSRRAHLFEFGVRPLIPRAVKRAYRRLRPRGVTSMNPGLHPGFIERTGLLDRVLGETRSAGNGAAGRPERWHSLNLSVFSQSAIATRKVFNRHRLELAVPYQDPRLVEYVMAVPADQLGLPGRDRRMHRRAMAALLPPTVVERTSKTSFVPLFEQGLRRQRADLRDLLADSQVSRRQMARAEWMHEALEGDLTDPKLMSNLWVWVCLEMWLRRFWT